MKQRKQKSHTDNDDVKFEEDVESLSANATARVQKLTQELKACRRERREYLEGWQRAQADFMNSKKSAGERSAADARRAVEQVVSDLIPALDSFDMAMGDTDAWSRVDENWRRGVEHIYAQLVRGLAAHGLEAINPLGLPFDPVVHESTGTRTADADHAPGTVTAVIQKGYRLNGSVLRPAKVEVAADSDSNAS